MLAEVVPVQPQIAGAGLAGLALLTGAIGFVVGLALYKAWTRTFGKIFYATARLIDVGIPTPFGTRHPLRRAANAIRKTSDAIGGAFLAISRGGEAAMSSGIAWFSFLLSWFLRDFADTAAVTGGLFARLFDHAIPNAKADAIGAATSAAKTRDATTTRETRRMVATTNAHVGALERTWAGQLEVLARGIDRITHRDLPAIRARTAALGRTIAHVGQRITGQAKRIGKLEALLAGGAFAALVARALSRLGLKWLRCNNTRRLGRATCGADPRIIEDLLLGLTVLGISFNLIEFAKDVQSVTDEAAGVIREIVT